MGVVIEFPGVAYDSRGQKLSPADLAPRALTPVEQAVLDANGIDGLFELRAMRRMFERKPATEYEALKQMHEKPGGGDLVAEPAGACPVAVDETPPPGPPPAA